jgi:thiamine pyrophosphate-dependent acetolactate synthase large subunit-like protein
MHFVSALDRAPGMRAVLGLFEGVVTGAADGYARMAEKPAATLLHLGPSLANGLANLHNARKAQVPVVNIIGDHATTHQRFDAPLTSDVAACGMGHIRQRRRPAPLLYRRDVSSGRDGDHPTCMIKGTALMGGSCRAS